MALSKRKQEITDEVFGPPGLWLGGIDGRYLEAAECEKHPAIVKLGRKFHDFQNSPYRGEWNQQTSMTMGEVRDVLIEIARLMDR